MARSVRSSTSRVKLDKFIKPMLATLTESRFDSKDWLFEIKWDGYRAIAELSGKNVKLYSRNGISFLGLYPEIAGALSALNLRAVFDGEIVVLDDEGKSDFQNLQHIDESKGLSLIYYVFDLLRLNGKDLTSLPLLERKARLRTILMQSGNTIRYRRR